MADPVSTTVAAAVADPPEPEPAPEREYALVPLDRIQVHPLNLRRELRGIDELADSVAQNGLLEPVLLVPASEQSVDGGEQFILIAGHRRHAACIKARHRLVESIIRRDLDSQGAQVIAMLTENGPRDDLTPIEEAHGYQLALSLNDLTPARLAKRLGKPRATITSRVALARLPEPVQDRIHSRQITLVEAEALVEFAGDRRVFDALLEQVGTSQFRFRVERERREREQRGKIARLRSELEATGVQVIDPPTQFDWRSVEKHVSHFVDPEAPAAEDGSPGRFTPAAHAAACSFHAVFVDPHDIRAVYVCTNPDEAKHVKVTARVLTGPIVTAGQPAPAAPEPTPEQIQAAQEAEQAEEQRRADERRLEAERRENLEIAGRMRSAFLTTLVRASGKSHVVAVLKLILTENFRAWLDDANPEDVQELAMLLDAKLTPLSGEAATVDDWLAEVTPNLEAALDSRRSPDALVGALLAMMAQDREFWLRDGAGWGDERCRRYVDFLIAQGYEPTPIERELIDRYDPDTSDVPAVATA